MKPIHLIINLEKNDYPKHVAKLVKTLLAQKEEAANQNVSYDENSNAKK